MTHSIASSANDRRVAELRARGERLPLKTGMCLAGWHEGAKPRTRDGKPIGTCRLFDSCPCNCHTDLDEIFEAGGRERVLIENPDYTPVKSDVSIYDVVEAPSLFFKSPEAAAEASRSVYTPALGVVPPRMRPTFAPTPSGRLARGQAAYLTLDVTDVWAVESQFTSLIEQCTPQYVCEQIMRSRDGVTYIDPSTVTAVYRRWEREGFAFISENPLRFTGYTPEAIAMGFETFQQRAAAREAMNGSR